MGVHLTPRVRVTPFVALPPLRYMPPTTTPLNMSSWTAQPVGAGMSPAVSSAAALLASRPALGFTPPELWIICESILSNTGCLSRRACMCFDTACFERLGGAFRPNVETVASDCP